MRPGFFASRADERFCQAEKFLSMEHQLLVLLGLHPKVLTETLYALCARRKVAVSKVIGIATSGAKQKAVAELLDPAAGEFYKLCREYPQSFKRIHFSPECIRVAGEEGREITDIRNSRQSQTYLDLIMATVAEMTSNAAVALHGAVAGGRRTMSVYLAMVMQLLARRQDRLYQLLVDPWEAETNSDFFFPTRTPHPMTTYDGNSFDAKDVTVELIEVPFLRLRPRVPNELLVSPNYKDILKWVQREVDVSSPILPLRIEVDKRCIAIGAIEIPLEPVELAIYWCFAEKSFLRPDEIPQEEYERYFERPQADGYFSRQASLRLWELYSAVVPREDMRLRFKQAFNKERRLPLEHLRPHFSRIKSKICEKFPNEDMHRWYLISAIGPRGDTCYGIRLDREFIRLPGPPRDAP
jgi:CRISPR-associated protein (TIGR02584 family)